MQVEGTIERLFFANDDAAAGVLSLGKPIPFPDGMRSTIRFFARLFGAEVGDRVSMEGEYVNTQYGYQLQASSARIYTDGIVDIKSVLLSGFIKGVGPALAEKIVVAFGEDTERVISTDWERLAEVPGITLDKAKTIHNCYNQSSTVLELISFFGGEATRNQINTIYKKYGDRAVETIQRKMIRTIDCNSKSKVWVVLIGDVDQLPPIGPGCLFRELVDSPIVPTTTLLFTHRFGGAIATNADLIKKGRGIKYFSFGSDFVFAELPKESTGDAVVEAYLEAVKASSVKDVQVIVPMKTRSNTGSNALNMIIREKVNPDDGSKTFKATKNLVFRLNDRVMQTKNDAELYTLALANYEVKVMFGKLIRDWFAKDQSFNGFVKSMLTGNVLDMNRYMNDVALNTFSSFDSGNKPSGKEPEKFYHGFVLGLIVDKAADYIIRSNRESGYGRYDVIMEPKDKSKVAVILEFKVIAGDEGEHDLNEAADNALKQIEDKRYDTELIANGISTDRILKYGLAFEGKRSIIKKA